MRGSRGRAFSWIEALLILSILALVLASSHPRVRGKGIARNESFALATLARLSRAEREFQEASPGNFASLSTLLVEGRFRLEGGTFLEGETLRAQGYLFRLSPLPEPSGESRPANFTPPFVALAWPIEYGRTGNGAFSLEGTGICRESRNARRRYSGLDQGPSPRAAERDPETLGTDPGRHFGLDREEWRLVPLPTGG